MSLSCVLASASGLVTLFLACASYLGFTATVGVTAIRQPAPKQGTSLAFATDGDGLADDAITFAVNGGRLKSWRPSTSRRASSAASSTGINSAVPALRRTGLGKLQSGIVAAPSHSHLATRNFAVEVALEHEVQKRTASGVPPPWLLWIPGAGSGNVERTVPTASGPLPAQPAAAARSDADWAVKRETPRSTSSRLAAPVHALPPDWPDRDVVNFDFAWRFALGDGQASSTQREFGPSPPAQAQVGFDDSGWEVLDAPHDMLIVGEYSATHPSSSAFLPHGDGWYRKHFALPADWRGSVVWIYFEGCYHQCTMWVNGHLLGQHVQGYTSFWYPLDLSLVRYDDEPGVNGFGENVIAVFVNASSGTGWWYEGGGLTRHYYLVRAAPVFMPPDASWAHADMAGAAIGANGPSPSDGLAASGVAFKAEAVVRNSLTWATEGVKLTVRFVGEGLAETARSEEVASIAPGAEHTFRVRASVPGRAQLWSVARPFLYTARLEVSIGRALIDAQDITFGARSIRFDADTGLWLNDRRTKLRGFCDHSNFGGLGAAVADRVNLFRAQRLRAIGANAWRMAHNPPVPVRLDIMDRLGMVAMDENRDYGVHRGSPEGVAEELEDMADLVRRDRSHASVLLWCFCNERGCSNESAQAAFRNVTYNLDGTRPVTQNDLGDSLQPRSLDVQGMSHASGSLMDSFHVQNPSKPVVSSECCSCTSQRGVDVDFCPSPHDHGSDACHDSQGRGGDAGVFYNNEVSECTSVQVADSDRREFNAGTFVWSGFDYLGESRGWPQTVKCRGAVADVAGFEKDTNWWFRSWWLSNISRFDHGRPVMRPSPSAEDAATLHIVESWVAAPGSETRTVHVYTNAPVVRLWLNGEAVGTAHVSFFGAAVFSGIAFSPGNLTAEALDDGVAGVRLATRSTATPLAAASLRLSLDAPSPHTMTGTALVADGEDVAMVRAEVLDARGELVTQGPAASTPVTFSVLSGGGRLLETHNGDPAHQSRGPTVEAHHGLARAFVRSSEVRAGSAKQRALLRRVHVDAGRGSAARLAGAEENEDGDRHPPPIVVEATLGGLPAAARLSIPLSRDERMLPLEVARAAGLAGYAGEDTPAGLDPP